MAPAASQNQELDGATERFLIDMQVCRHSGSLAKRVRSFGRAAPRGRA